MGYYIIQDHETRGPYTVGQLRAIWASGAITTETLYCRAGYSDWLPLSGMIQELEAPPAPTIPPAGCAPLTPSGKKQRGRILGLCLVVFLGLLVLGMIFSLARSEDPRQLLLEAASSLRKGNPTDAAQILNRIVSEHPTSPQAKTVRYLHSFLRAKQNTNGQPLTAEQQLAMETITMSDKQPVSHQPLTEAEARKLSELLVMYEDLRNGSGLEDFSFATARIAEMREKARREILDEMQGTHRER